MEKRFNGFKSRKAQGQIMGLSFGMIFSLLLIVFFIVVAFFVIKEFLVVEDCAKVGIFIDKLESDVKKAWNSQYVSHDFQGVLTSKIKAVCFADLSSGLKGPVVEIGEEIKIYKSKEANMFFYPIKKSCDMPYHLIEHLDIDEITSNENPYCIPVVKGGTRFKIIKDLGEGLVRVERG